MSNDGKDEGEILWIPFISHSYPTIGKDVFLFFGLTTPILESMYYGTKCLVKVHLKDFDFDFISPRSQGQFAPCVVEEMHKYYISRFEITNE